ncbi:MAG: hypothetical protein COU81_01930 [Candidatus Portnoybacteria bacterium CG10_big_fil_rev_8_21_14_0_10_36_7]|uniref:Glycosyltransferase 2-like domain-containing protein n=1 Tax=Candidatus Portnoybacteria bacterium CG10_big_fil_rev_8_21_14_0_10_36_7 TaxID=1974812 RepID=A0A2M8KE57_9BACT|nr:MAG: hypothetical protein COU81_01930 [Candidatus Portnoybacteria bacterium CG10_big_fil_rev_8_21_14_0_10_36_7]
MKLSIIITHHQTPELLKLCLKSLEDTLNNVEYEIFIADSESQDEVQQEIKEKFPKVFFLQSTNNLGYAKIANRAILRSKGKYIFIVNADVITSENAIQKMLDYLDNHNDIGALGPQLINFDGTIQHSRFRFYTPMTAIYRRTLLGKLPAGKKNIARFLISDKPLSKDNTGPYEVDWIQGSAFLTRADALEKVGVLDENFFMYFEDVDWCKRFKDKDFKVFYFPDAKMYHYHIRISYKRGNVLDLFFNKYSRVHVLSAIKFFWKHRKHK